MRSESSDQTVFMPPAADYPLRSGPAKPLARRDAVCLALLLLVALLPRLGLALQLGPVCDDGYFYLAVAEAYERGDLKTALWYLNINLYPILLMGFKGAGLDPLSAAKAWGVAVGTLTVLPLFGWLRRLLDRRCALAACGLYAVHPEFIEISPEPIRDATFWLLAAMSLYLFWRAAAERKLWLFGSAGIALALAAHTRSEGWLFALPAIAWPVVHWGENVRARWKLVAGTALAFSMTPLLIATLNVTVLQNHTRWEWGKLEHFRMPYRWVVGDQMQAMPPQVATTPAPPPALPSPKVAPNRWRDISPTLEARLNEGTSRRSDGSFELVRAAVHSLEPVTLLLMLLGAIAGRRLLLRREHLVLSGICLAVALGVVIRQATLGEINGRYFLACFFPASGAAGIGIVWVLSQLERGWAARLSHSRAALATATMALVVGGAHVAEVMAGEHPSRDRDARIGQLLGDRIGHDQTMVVLPHACRVGYYAGQRLPIVVLDNTPIESLLARHQANVVILEHGYTPPSRCADLAGRLIKQGWRPLELAGIPEADDSFLVLVGPSTSLASATRLRNEDADVR